MTQRAVNLHTHFASESERSCSTEFNSSHLSSCSQSIIETYHSAVRRDSTLINAALGAGLHARVQMGLISNKPKRSKCINT